MNSEKNLLIIGGVAAGTSAATKARRTNPNIDITILEKGPFISYAGCGLPYIISGIISEAEKLLIRAPEKFEQDLNIRILTNHCAEVIEPDQKIVRVKDITGNQEKIFPYDKLVIATGAYAVKPPLPNIDLPNIFVLRTYQDGLKIKNFVKEQKPKKAVVVGAGYIGLEVVENLVELEIDTTVVELEDQVMPGLDPDIMNLVENTLTNKKVKVFTSEKVKSFEGDKIKGVRKVITDKRELEADFVLVSVGARPEVKLAVAAGIKIGSTGAIACNSYQQTNIADIFTGGDCAESLSRITKKPVWIPLGSTANKHGRVAGENCAIALAGGTESEFVKFAGVTHTMITKVFTMIIGKTGLSEKEALQEGFDCISSIVHSNDHSGYYPGAQPLTIKVVVSRPDGRLLGAQTVGKAGVDKRNDVFATAIYNNMTCKDIIGLDLAYAPPFALAVDSVLVSANEALAKLEQNILSLSCQAVKKKLESTAPPALLDVRAEKQFQGRHLAGAQNIPLEQLKEKAAKLDPKIEYVIYDDRGKESLKAVKLLKKMGFDKLLHLEGGMRMWVYKDFIER